VAWGDQRGDQRGSPIRQLFLVARKTEEYGINDEQ